MRILFLTHYYPPEVNAPASRTSEHCRIWASAGHHVTVITPAPSHPRGLIYPGFSNRLFQTETIDGVEVVRVWTYLAANEGFAKRTLNYVSFMIFALLAVPRLGRPDVIVTTSPQFFCGLAGLVAKWMRRRPWVLEVRDLWPESIVTVGAMRKGVLSRTLEALEGFAYRNADHIVSVTDSFVSHIALRCQGADKISVVKNGVDLTLFQRNADADPDAVKARFGLAGRFIAAYVGTHGMAHGLDTIIDAALLLRHDPRFGFLMVGDGAEQSRLAERARTLALENLRIVGQRPKSDMPGIWAATDASLILLRRSDTFTKVLPSKMFEAMAMGCPIILGVEGEAKALLDEACAGMAITPQSAEELVAALVQLADNPEQCTRLAQSGERYVREHYDRTLLAGRYLSLLADVALRRRPPAPGDAEHVAPLDRAASGKDSC